jgi:hypothetical protein
LLEDSRNRILVRHGRGAKPGFLAACGEPAERRCACKRNGSPIRLTKENRASDFLPSASQYPGTQPLPSCNDEGLSWSTPASRPPAESSQTPAAAPPGLICCRPAVDRHQIVVNPSLRRCLLTQRRQHGIGLLPAARRHQG